MYGFLKNHWVAGAGLTSGALLLMVPLLRDVWPLGLLLIFLHSPGYMIHQVEEHAGDRFRTFVNQRLFGGREALATIDILWVNVAAVWGLDLAALYAGRYLGLGWGLAAPYLMLVNALSHIAAAFRFPLYNPGLVTSVLIFAPLGVATLVVIPGTSAQHIVGLALALAAHAAIGLLVIRRLRLTKPGLDTLPRSREPTST